MSSILETFIILFKSNYDELKKGENAAKDSSKKLNESLRESDEFTRKLGDSFGDLAGEVSTAIASLVAAGGVFEGLKHAAEYSEELFKISKELNINATEIDLWGRAVEHAGGSAQGFQSTIKTLKNNIDQFNVFGNAPFQNPLATIGIQVGKNTDVFKLYLAVAQQFERIQKQKNGLETTRILGQQIGFDEGSILLLQKGVHGIEELIKRQKLLGVISKEDTRISFEFGESIKDVATASEVAFTKLGSAIFPTLTKLLNGFTNFIVFIQEHSGVLTGTIAGISTIILGRLVPAILAVDLALLPVIASTAGIILLGAALGLLIEDIKTFEEGGVSVTGSIIKKWPIVLEVFRAISAALKEMPIVKLIQSIENALTRLSNAYEKIKNNFKTGSLTSKIPPVGFLNSTFVSTHLDKAKQALNNVANFPIGLRPATSLTSNTTNNQRPVSVTTGPISIITQATDSGEIADNFTSKLQTYIKQAFDNFTNGLHI